VGDAHQVHRHLEDFRDAGMRTVSFIAASLHSPRLVFYTFWLGRIARRLR
jgi:hypothetical protein